MATTFPLLFLSYDIIIKDINSPTISPQSFIEEVDDCHLFSSYFVPVVSCPSCPSPISFPLTFCPNFPSPFIMSLTSSSDLSTVSRDVSRSRLVESCHPIGYPCCSHYCHRFCFNSFAHVVASQSSSIPIQEHW